MDHYHGQKGASNAFIISNDEKDSAVKLSSCYIRKTSEIDKIQVEALIDPSTYILNVNSHLNKLSGSDQILDLGVHIGNIFVNDAIAISYGCSLLDSRIPLQMTFLTKRSFVSEEIEKTPQ